LGGCVSSVQWIWCAHGCGRIWCAASSCPTIRNLPADPGRPWPRRSSGSLPAAVPPTSWPPRVRPFRPSGGIRDGRVLSCQSPAAPSSWNRSCQRQITVLALPVARTISAVPQPSAVRRTICTRQKCFYRLLPFATTASSSLRSVALNRMFLRSCIPQTRTRASRKESPTRIEVLDSYGPFGLWSSCNQKWCIQNPGRLRQSRLLDDSFGVRRIVGVFAVDYGGWVLEGND
jgi:hypothetical protein